MFYYCSAASDIVLTARLYGIELAVQHWLAEMESNLDADYGDWFANEAARLRGPSDYKGAGFVAGSRMRLANVLARRSEEISGFAKTAMATPDGSRSNKTVVFYPFSGLDVLHAISISRSTDVVMLADLPLGDGPPSERLACFASEACVRSVSRTTFKIVHNWATHSFAWLETALMVPLTATEHSGGCLAPLLFLSHVSGLRFPRVVRPLPLSASERRLLNGTLIEAGGVRVTFVSIRLREEAALLRALENVLNSVGGVATTDGRPLGRAPANKGTSTQAVARGRRTLPRFTTLLKAAPEEVTGAAWFERWLLGLSENVFQDDTGLALSVMQRAVEEATIYGRERPGRAATLSAFGHYERLQSAREFWKLGRSGLYGRRPEREANDQLSRALANGEELPFLFGYAAHPWQCRNVTPSCNGVAFVAAGLN